MNKGLYIATLEPHSGKSMIILGLMQSLLGKMAKVAYFKPVVASEEEKDNHIETILSHFGLNSSYDESYAVTRDELIRNRNSGKIADSLEKIISKYKKLESTHDFVLVEGTDFLGGSSVFEFDWNVNIAKNLGLPVLLISTGIDKTFKEFDRNLEMAYKSFQNRDVQVIGIVANKIQEENVEALKQHLDKYLPENVEKIIVPLVSELQNPSIKEIVEELDAEVLVGKENLSNLTGKFAVGAMQLPNFLNHIDQNSLVITPGDRADIILGSLQAHISSKYPSVAGIVLTGGIKPEETIMRLIEGTQQNVPIVSVKTGTFETTQKIGAIRSDVSKEKITKIQSALDTFGKFVSPENFIESMNSYTNKVVTPMMFQYSLIDTAKKARKKIVLPESGDPRILTATERLSKLGIVDIVLLGNEEQIKAHLKELNLQVDFANVEIVDPENFDKFEDYVNTFYELRKHKGVNMDMARDTMRDVSYFGTMMIYKGDADGMVSGAVHTTQHTIRPALQFIKTKPGCSIVSSVFFMCLEDRVSVFGDCAINPNPTAEQLAEIAISSADSAAAFGIEPKVAMLSYSSGNSGKGADVDKVREATELVKAKRPDLKIEGPIQYDAAVDANVGRQKMPDSEVAGQASVLIFPDLNTGNNTYKAVQRETGAIAIGPMLQGLNRPVNDLSRGCTVDDIFNTVIITAIQAQDF
ncbi:phosphate acetyltransferase [Ornithobacterium rhinotracheale]|uniref:Phosphate acetyltransferase n=1 Tax=Ornithobacterium rhinotracheale (strain ATCC 51463 / DSM 15997 / CCUG 23171 / CIP 104009 / LMG 9086) TaxID=867902 RepID=I4A391_ORNRL|nr:phosphate acetyltransferase [Ornithobacterium rhinotracheale]AFL98425.1 phosphate acetyltransferase [Ornithobacterium rhinotracheale DSM 15997]AIQ00156.1 phosphate acetyltransferase [Ornithobacterium rhinotracheale ORT-UMN 88]KGB65746.1 phosphate acetyltransferase [Ornithobacterium rhinotracheale H06-030791]MBN3662853.1 phosphate acetyltransferase [Ornithobacterium rhinotracheale]MCK0193228.1 phosphate acetyltransferase [Ornithobacterium rhinotracheale]